MNQPVALSCGHIVGIQCLAEWMLSQNFDGRCFYCRTVIVDPIRNPDLLQAQNPIVTAAFIDLETLCLFDGQISTSKKTAHLNIFEKSLKSRWGDGVQDLDRLVMLWEVVLDSMCNQSAQPQPIQ